MESAWNFLSATFEGGNGGKPDIYEEENYTWNCFLCHSPDLAPRDFYLKKMLAERRFGSKKEVIADTEAYLQSNINHSTGIEVLDTLECLEGNCVDE